MRYNLYLDDERMPKTDTKFFIVRNYKDFVYTIQKNGIPQYISFDHDLGDKFDGYDCANWLYTACMLSKTKLPDNFNYNVHSANPVGAKRIVACMENLIKLQNKG